MSNDRLAKVIAAIDAANAADPQTVDTGGGAAPAQVAYSRRMSAMLDEVRPEASEAVRIAVHGQHIERWKMPRQDFPEGRAGYLRWRKQLQRFHAARLAEIMGEAGYDDAATTRVGALVMKKGLGRDEDTQTLEDVACLVFLKHYAGDFIAAHDDSKVIAILKRTAAKMSPAAIEKAAAMELDARLARLLTAALAGG